MVVLEDFDLDLSLLQVSQQEQASYEVRIMLRLPEDTRPYGYAV